MTEEEILERLARCSYCPGSFAKQFMRQTVAFTKNRPMTSKERAMVRKFGHTYRRQLGQCMNAECTMCKEHVAAPIRGIPHDRVYFDEVQDLLEAQLPAIAVGSTVRMPDGSLGRVVATPTDGYPLPIQLDLGIGDDA